MQHFLKIICSALLVAAAVFGHLQPVSAAENKAPVVPLDYTVLAGEWQRTDGPYVVNVSNVQPDGKVTVAYFNPRSIHIEQAVITTRADLIRLFIQLRDTGYEGSTYTLYYYAEKDALAGFYYQATLDRTFEVIFLRKNN